MLGKRALQTGVQVAQDVLAKRSKEAIGGLVPQTGSGRKSTKRKVQFRGLPPFKKQKNSCVGSGPKRLSTLVVNLSGTPWQNYKILIPVIFNHFTTMSRVVKNNLPFLHLLTCCPEHQRQFRLETATPEQIHALVQILFNVCHGNIPVAKSEAQLKKAYRCPC